MISNVLNALELGNNGYELAFFAGFI